mmetsp:Transcript_54052/g.118498  ORF Transcript_54052/g.118498 Transcript_54052/m.118498 type:complete len:430 (+) Transcript_54052:33-1322(+)
MFRPGAVHVQRNNATVQLAAWFVVLEPVAVLVTWILIWRLCVEDRGQPHWRRRSFLAFTPIFCYDGLVTIVVLAILARFRRGLLATDVGKRVLQVFVHIMRIVQILLCCAVGSDAIAGRNELSALLEVAPFFVSFVGQCYLNRSICGSSREISVKLLGLDLVVLMLAVIIALKIHGALNWPWNACLWPLYGVAAVVIAFSVFVLVLNCCSQERSVQVVCVGFCTIGILLLGMCLNLADFLEDGSTDPDPFLSMGIAFWTLLTGFAGIAALVWAVQNSVEEDVDRPRVPHLERGQRLRLFAMSATLYRLAETASFVQPTLSWVFPPQTPRSGISLPRPASRQPTSESPPCSPTPMRPLAWETCTICYDEDRHADCVFVPCGHGGFCKACAELTWRRLEACPVCRTPSNGVAMVKRTQPHSRFVDAEAAVP